MKCNQCGTEFEGKFCPECGAKTGDEATAQQVYQQPTPTTVKPAKKKKPFFLKWWFILLLAIVVVGIIALSAGNGGEKIVWDDVILGEMLPEPPSTKGEIHENSAENLWMDIAKLSDKQYTDYVNACKEKGFTVDAESDSISYEAYNAEGYKLSLDHYDSDANMSIQLEAPMEMDTIKWPTSTAGKQLPVPKSKTGNFSFEYEDNFFVSIGNTSKADYDEYVNACSKKGFTVDYNKGDSYYYADNSEGWHVSLNYTGNNIMTIDIDAPDAESTNTSSAEESKSDTAKKENTDKAGLSPDFKAAMDSYENFMNEYVAFMKKYKENPGDVGLLSEYTDYMSKYADCVEDFEKWEDEEMNATEAAYYIDVQTRVNKKLLEVAN